MHASGTCSELEILQETAHIPVATTSIGRGAVSEAHALSIGVIGYVMGRGARAFALRAMIERSDLILLVGNRTDQNGTDS